MHTRWHRQLWSFLRTREGVGTLLIAAFSAIALGVVPNMLEKLWDSGWFYLAAFLTAAVIVVLGWILRRERGVGVVVSLFPQHLTQTSRVTELRRASQHNHSSTLSIDPRLLSPGNKPLPPADRADLVANLIDARADEYKSSGGEGTITLYPLAQLRDGFLLGRRLFADHHASLSVMHSSRDDAKTVVPGVTLAAHLTHPLTPQRQALIAATLRPTPGHPHPQPVPHPTCPPEHRHRLALIVRLTPATTMVDDAIHVATTGDVRRPTDRTHTGYVLDETNPEATGTPCGAHVVIEASVAQLPETQEAFEAVATHLTHAWSAAREAWKAHNPGTAVDTRLFITAPLPIAIALGWLTANDNISVVHHDNNLHNTPAPAQATP